MAQIDGQPDHAAPEPESAPVLRTVGISPKALWGTVAALALSLGVPGLQALIEYATSNPQLFDALPWWVRVPLMAIIVAAGTALAAARANPGNIQVR